MLYKWPGNVRYLKIGAWIEALRHSFNLHVLTYKSANPFPFIVTVWTLMMISIMGLSDLFRKWLVDLNMFEKLHKWQVVPMISGSNTGNRTR